MGRLRKFPQTINNSLIDMEAKNDVCENDNNKVKTGELHQSLDLYKKDQKKQSRVDKLIESCLFYLQMKKIFRVLYIVALVIVLSLFSSDKEFYVVEMLTGKHSIFNMVRSKPTTSFILVL